MTTTIAQGLRHLLAAAMLSLVWSAACPQGLPLVAEVIVSPSLKTVALDRSLLRAVFTMRVREWPDGSPVRVFVLPDDDPLSDMFYRERLGMYSYVLRRAWDRMVFTGTGFAPTIVQSEQEMRQLVRSTPGAIGYVRRNERDPSGYRYQRSRTTLALLTADVHD
jgi:hypothetical protein